MRLSEAILLGSTMKPQTDGTFFADDGTCALGAACEAVGQDPMESACTTIQKFWAWIANTPTKCPDCEMLKTRANKPISVYGTIVHLNDHHRWTRERIAEWVSTMEPSEEPANAAVTGEREAEAVGSVERGQVTR